MIYWACPCGNEHPHFCWIYSMEHKPPLLNMSCPLCGRNGGDIEVTSYTLIHDSMEGVIAQLVDRWIKKYQTI